MNSFCKKSWIVSSCLVVCCAVMLPGTVSGQESELETLKRQLKEMQDQMRTMAERIELMEQEKEAEQSAPSQSAQSAAQSFPGALNPAISVIGNFVGRADTQRVFNDSGDRIDNKMNLREAEIDMRVPIDPYADGVLIASLESESPGKFSAGVEEGYVTIKKLPFLDEPPLGLKLKVGRFRPTFGLFNILHTHDLPTTFRSRGIVRSSRATTYRSDGRATIIRPITASGPRIFMGWISSTAGNRFDWENTNRFFSAAS